MFRLFVLWLGFGFGHFVAICLLLTVALFGFGSLCWLVLLVCRFDAGWLCVL